MQTIKDIPAGRVRDKPKYTVEWAKKGLDHEGNPLPHGDIFDDSVWQALKRAVPKYAKYDKL